MFVIFFSFQLGFAATLVATSLRPEINRNSREVYTAMAAEERKAIYSPMFSDERLARAGMIYSCCLSSFIRNYKHRPTASL